MDISRTLDLSALLAKKSFFLFGPRGTGKSWLIRKQLPKEGHLRIDLLNSDSLLELSARPALLETKIVDSRAQVVIIDEIQKIPHLLDEVHRMIEEKRIRFLLTGSSARRLKKEHANLLGGRAWEARLFPLTSNELSEKFDLERALRFGTLPAVYLSQEPREELKAYVGTYLKEEIQQEGWVRQLPAFSRFLLTAALTSGEMVNFSNVGSDAQVAAATVREYYQILEDTLLGYFLEPWTKSKKRKAIQTAKFYLFDNGVYHQLIGTKSDQIERNTDLYGKSFEHWMAMELRAWLSYRRQDEQLCYWRTDTRQEVDFLIGDEIAIEVKASSKTTLKDIKNLRALQDEKKFRKYIIVSHDRSRREEAGVLFIYWQDFLKQLWSTSKVSNLFMD